MAEGGPTILCLQFYRVNEKGVPSSGWEEGNKEKSREPYYGYSSTRTIEREGQSSSGAGCLASNSRERSKKTPTGKARA